MNKLTIIAVLIGAVLIVSGAAIGHNIFNESEDDLLEEEVVEAQTACGAPSCVQGACNGACGGSCGVPNCGCGR